MQEMTLQDLQRVSLEILIHFHKFCEDNHLRYSLAGGTLIGAIRHKGFIPWDDDIDVLMPRPDYEKLCQLYRSDGEYMLFSPQLNNSYVAFTRLCEMKKTIVKPALIWNTIGETGVWIDIMPEDGMPEDVSTRKDRIKESIEILGNTYMLRYLIDPKTRLKTKIGILINACGRISKMLFKGDLSIKRQLEKHHELCIRIPFDSSQHFGNFTFDQYCDREFFHTEDFHSLIDVEFEGLKFKSLAGYDRHLRELFGDYMKLPPKEKQVRIHSGHSYYWRGK